MLHSFPSALYRKVTKCYPFFVALLIITMIGCQEAKRKDDFSLQLIEDIPGKPDTLKNNTELQLITFSGTRKKDEMGWGQFICKVNSGNRKGEVIRLVVSQYHISSSKDIKEYMTYQVISEQELTLINQLNNGNHDIEGEMPDKEGIIDFAQHKNPNKIQVFFNPEIELMDEKPLPIVIGKFKSKYLEK